MIIDKLPNQGDFSGQPFEFQLSGVRELWSQRGAVGFIDGTFEFIISNAEKITSNYIVGQSYAFVATNPACTIVYNGLFTVISVTAFGSNWKVLFSTTDELPPENLFYPAKSNSAFASSIAVTITDTVTSEATTFNFPVTTAGDAQFYLGSFIDDAIRAKGLTIPFDGGTSPARSIEFDISVNEVILNYSIAFGGRFNISQENPFIRQFRQALPLFRREGSTDFFAFSYFEIDGSGIKNYGDVIDLFSSYPIDGIQTISLGSAVPPIEVNIITPCKKKDYQLKALQIGSNTYDVTAPILRFLNPIGGVEEAWASGNNELTLNQGDTRFYQTILGETKIAGRNNSYQGMTLELVPQDYLTDLRAIEAEINRLAAIQYSDYVELVAQNADGNWASIPVIVTPNSFVIASNNSNQLRQSISFEITFASPL